MAQLDTIRWGAAIAELESDLGLSSDTIGRAIQVGRRTVERWRTNQTAPHGAARQRLADLLALRERLLSQLGESAFVREWLNSSSLYLVGFTPVEALRAGRLDRVLADLDGLASGTFL